MTQAAAFAPFPLDETPPAVAVADALSPFVAPDPQSALITPRDRAAFAGPSALVDGELVEALAARHHPDRAGAITSTLMARYGTIPAILAADQAGLRLIAGDTFALDIALVSEIARRAARASVLDRCLVTSTTAVTDYLKTAMAGRSREAFVTLFLDRKNRLIADEIMGEGSVDHAPVYPREVIRRALELSASALILSHNHPSGDPTPSTADVEMTKKIVEAAKPLHIAVHDHIIVGSDKVASLKTMGLM